MSGLAEQVGVRELKTRLSFYLRKVSKGSTVIVTDRGKPVAELRPAAEPPGSKLAAMVSLGQVKWSGKRPAATPPPGTTRPGKSVADLVLSDRE